MDQPEGLTVIDSPLPVYAGDKMAEAFRAYKTLQKALDEAMPDAIMLVGDRSFRKKNYWRAVAVAFKLSVERIQEECRVSETGDSTWLVTYRATAPNGRFADGDGACADSEKTTRQGDIFATVHNVRSHANTRAFNRAVSNLVGFGEVSAEEVERDEHNHAKAVGSSSTGAKSTPHQAGDPVYVKDISVKSGNKNGKDWKSFLIALTDGRSGSTFESGLAERAEDFQVNKTPVIATFETKGKYTNLTAIRAAASQPASGTSSPAKSDVADKPSVFTITKVVEFPDRKGTYGIETKELGERQWIETKDLGLARLANEAKVAGDKLEMAFHSLKVKTDQGETCQRTLIEVSIVRGQPTSDEPVEIGV